MITEIGLLRRVPGSKSERVRRKFDGVELYSSLRGCLVLLLSHG